MALSALMQRNKGCFHLRIHKHYWWLLFEDMHTLWDQVCKWCPKPVYSFTYYLYLL